LVEAFRSTLEEVGEADLILHVVDASDADPEAQIRAVREVLADVDALGVPEQLVFNKIDAATPEALLRLRPLAPTARSVSARTAPSAGPPGGQGVALAADARTAAGQGRRLKLARSRVMELFSPSHLLIVAIVAFVLFFGWKQLPDMSRSLGRSLRVFKTEIKGL